MLALGDCLLPASSVKCCRVSTVTHYNKAQLAYQLVLAWECMHSHAGPYVSAWFLHAQAVTASRNVSSSKQARSDVYHAWTSATVLRSGGNGWALRPPVRRPYAGGALPRAARRSCLLLKCCSNFDISPIIDNKTISCRVRIPTEPEITGLHNEALILQGV